MPIDLSAFERGEPFQGNVDAELSRLRDRLSALHLAQVVHRKRLIVLFEGWVGGGKKGALRQVTSALDPCHTTVHCVNSLRAGDDERHWFVPFWEALPPPGETSLFFRSWYSRAAIGRASGELTPKAWTRSFDEINEFENQQREHGTVLVKLFFHVSPDVQAERIRQQMQDPWMRHLLSKDEIERVANRAELDPIVRELYDATNTRWAPWTPIDAGDAKASQVAALSQVVKAMEKGIPAEPPEEERTAEIVDFAALRRG